MKQLKKCFVAMALLTLPVLAPPEAKAQSDDETIYTYVAEWRIARDKRAEFWSAFKKNNTPLLDRLVDDGTLTEWGATTAIVHTEDGMTDGVWWCATKFSGTQRVLAEMEKSNQPPVADVFEKHSDRLLESEIFRVGSAKADHGFLEVHRYQMKPGQSSAWMALWEQYTKPIYEKLLADGAILGYGIDREYVHTGDPARRSIWVLSPNAEAIDKIDAAFATARSKATPAERRAVGRAFADATVPGSHRDALERVTHYKRK